MKRIAFFSNFLNHHQLPLCLAFNKMNDVEFVFVATTPIPQERLNMGYADMNHAYPFVLCTYDSAEDKKKATTIADTWDCVIIGAAPDEYVRNRLDAGKITFHFSERILKKGLFHSMSVKGLVSNLNNHAKYRNAASYLLCASAYATDDFNRLGAYRNKAYKWGYFPDVTHYDVDDLMSRKLSVTSGWKHPKVSILWAGRLIGLKHPDVSIELAASLKEKGYSFRMSIIGNGEMEQQLRTMIEQKHLTDCVEMLGAMSPEEVRSYMEKADIFLFTSDFNEGWGAVLNESMNSGCAVVASHAIGSVPFLIKDGENGLIYRNGDQQDFEQKVLKLLEHPELRTEIGKKAYQTLEETWNAETAADRFLQLCDGLDKGKPAYFEEGPCSCADRIAQKDMYEYCKRE